MTIPYCFDTWGDLWHSIIRFYDSWTPEQRKPLAIFVGDASALAILVPVWLITGWYPFKYSDWNPWD